MTDEEKNKKSNEDITPLEKGKKLSEIFKELPYDESDEGMVSIMFSPRQLKNLKSGKQPEVNEKKHLTPRERILKDFMKKEGENTEKKKVLIKILDSYGIR